MTRTLDRQTLPGVEDIKLLNQEFESKTPQEILQWAAETYGPRAVALSSFGASSGALLHMISEIDNNIPVVFLQTHYHFDETLKFRDELADKYNLRVENWEVWGGRPEFLKHFPDDLNARENLEGIDIPEAARGKVQTGVDLCCWLNKVEPLQRALRGRDAYITSLRRDGGTERRARTQILEAFEIPDSDRIQVKINPMANWSKQQLFRYIHDHQIPTHPLWAEGFSSIGCRPCTVKALGGEERAGRWRNQGKDECGIHTQQEPINYSI